MSSVGIIGSGRWGRNLARCFSKKRNIKRVVSTGNIDNIDRIKEICPEITVSSFEDVLHDQEIDTVVVAVPIKSLSNIALRCLKSGKNVFLEKPAAVSSKELDVLRSVIKNQVCLVNYMYLADPAYQSFKNAALKRKVRKATFSWEKYGTFGNDILLNLVSHDLSMIFDTFEEDCISAVVSTIKDDYCKIKFRMGEIETVIEIDRNSRSSNKSVTYETDDGLLMWTPGHFAHEEMEVSTNAANMLLDVQRDNFLSYTKNGVGYNNLDLSYKILKFLDRARQ